MAIFFRTSIDTDATFEKIQTSLKEASVFDGYSSVHGGLTFSPPNHLRVDEFKQEVVDALRTIWETAQFWTVCLCDEQRNGHLMRSRRRLSSVAQITLAQSL